MHVLLTADTITGTWAYAREVAIGLTQRGVRVTLVSFGEIPLPHQTQWMDTLPGLDYRPTGFRLEWMQEGKNDLEESRDYLQAVIEEVKPDVLHLTQYAYGNLPGDVPRIVVAHGDLISWWISVHGHEPRETEWLRWYRRTAGDGLSGASAVAAPSFFMLDSVRALYAKPRRGTVIYSGRNPVFFNPYLLKSDSVLTVGRLHDAGKQVILLTQREQPLPVCIVSSDQPLDEPKIPLRADVKLKTDRCDVAFRGPQTEAQLRLLYSRAAIYAATSRYEPFGMAALEAALSRCAIVANDIPVFREVWGDAAVYFRTNDSASLSDAIRRLSEDRELCRAHGNLAYQRARSRFTAKQMLDGYLDLYRSLLKPQRLAA
jgi:glycogen(starch) synthase